jgi:glycosyltransferase involved in cell wall biosynthesis
MKEVSLLIATRNRLPLLKETLLKSKFLIEDERVECIILDDHSNDGTYNYIKEEYPEIKLIRTQSSKGILHARNLLYKEVKTPIAITLDDDTNFAHPIDIDEITNYFKDNPNCAVMAFRIYWGEKNPTQIKSKSSAYPVKSFGAGAHAINIKYWKKIPKLPEWFRFYGEEDYMSLHFLQKGFFVHYTPLFLVHHRTNLKDRKKDNDYIHRMRMSLRAGWYIYFIFYPKEFLFRKMLYSIWMQFKLKILRGNISALKAVLLAIGDLAINMSRLQKERTAFTIAEYEKFKSLPDAKLYWKPETNEHT